LAMIGIRGVEGAAPYGGQAAILVQLCKMGTEILHSLSPTNGHLEIDRSRGLPV